jgi:hypothetical protein
MAGWHGCSPTVEIGGVTDSEAKHIRFVAETGNDLNLI